jgi:hypothetical protein
MIEFNDRRASRRFRIAFILVLFVPPSQKTATGK